MKEKQRFSWNCFISLKSSKDRWNFINNVRGQNQSVNIAAVKNSFGDLIVDDKKIAEHFNFISNLGQYFGREYESAPVFKAGDESFCFCPITEKDCYDILKQIIPHKPTGPCKVPAWAIIDGQKILVPHLTFVLNECIKDCVFPSMLKRAVITSIFKKDDILDPLNYRPISITTPFSKIFEKCLHKKITAYAESRGILTPLQFGFRSKVSAQVAILYFIETIQHEIEIGDIVHAVLLDLSKAFHSLSHQILLKKLESLHFSPSATQIVESFFNRSIATSLCEWCSV